MKAFIKFKNRQVAKRLATMGLIGLLAISCGKENKVDSDNAGNPSSSSSPSSSVDNAYRTELNNLKSQYKCSQSNSRVDITFRSNQGGNNTTISGSSIQKGGPLSGKNFNNVCWSK